MQPMISEPLATRTLGFYAGLDLGQAAEYTALAVVEKGEEETLAETWETFLHLRHLERYELRTPYPKIAEHVATLMRDERLIAKRYDAWGEPIYHEWAELLVDQTGVGKAVTDLFKSKGLRFKAVTITAGEHAHYEGGSHRVPKGDLVAALEVPFQTGALTIAEGLALGGVLRKELLNFKRKVNLKIASDSYEHWRESDHDDLVLAAALACWGATRRKGALQVMRKPAGF
jgi:hypothetical protein